MSSFICDAKHFNSIEVSFKMLLYSNTFHFPQLLCEKYPKLYYHRDYLAETLEAEIESIFNTLRELQVLTVCLQYKDHYSLKLDQQIKAQTKYLFDAKKQEANNLTIVELYKALQCLTYQIETEHLKDFRQLTIEEENAIFFCETMQRFFAAEIVRNLDSYKEAKWSIE